jgi:hypothetical protein
VCLSWETNASAKTLIILWSTFWALPFINPNTWHLICNNFKLNFIFGIVCLCVCVCAFLLRRESPDMILGDKPFISEVVLSQLVPEQDWGKTHTKASKKSQQRFRWGTFSPHKDSSSFFRWQANLCVNLRNYEIASTKVCCDFWSVHLILLLIYATYFNCINYRIASTTYCLCMSSFIVYGYFWLFVFSG